MCVLLPRPEVGRSLAARVRTGGGVIQELAGKRIPINLY